MFVTLVFEIKVALRGGAYESVEMTARAPGPVRKM